MKSFRILYSPEGDDHPGEGSKPPPPPDWLTGGPRLPQQGASTPFPEKSGLSPQEFPPPPPRASGGDYNNESRADFNHTPVPDMAPQDGPYPASGGFGQRISGSSQYNQPPRDSRDQQQFYSGEQDYDHDSGYYQPMSDDSYGEPPGYSSDLNAYQPPPPPPPGPPAAGQYQEAPYGHGRQFPPQPEEPYEEPPVGEALNDNMSSEMPRPETHPKYQQPSIKDLQGVHEEREAQEGLPHDPPSGYRQQMQPQADPPSGVDVLKGMAAPPAHLPNLEVDEFAEGRGGYYEGEMLTEDGGSMGRRVAGVAWIFFAVLMCLVFYLKGGEAGVGFSLVTMSPMMIVGLLLLTGTYWSGIIGMILGASYGGTLLFMGVIAAIAHQTAIETRGVDFLPQEVSIAFAGLGVCFAVATMMMLISSPRTGRVTAGALLLIVPQLAAMAWVSNLDISYQRKLTTPGGTWDTEKLGSEEEGYFFVKPDGWATFDWNMVVEHAPVARDMSKVPDYFFLNKAQNMMVAFYLVDPPSLSLQKLINNDSRTDVEKDIARQIPRNSEEPETFAYGGQQFEEMRYTGIGPSDQELDIVVDRTRLDSGRILVITLVRDDGSDSVTRADADQALNAFFADLEFYTPPPPEPEEEEQE